MHKSKLTVLAYFAISHLLEDEGVDSMAKDEILRAAHSYINSIITDQKNVESDPDPYDHYITPIDKALADGGWNVMYNNPEWYEEGFFDEI